MVEKVLRRFAATDENGNQYQIEEYVLVVTTTQLSDSHLATEQGSPHYRLTSGEAVVSLGDGRWQVSGSAVTLLGR